MKRILIVDDDVHIGNMLEESLSKEGYAVSRAYSGTEAVLSVSLCKPDLVLLDLMLPGLSGEEVLPKLRGIPVIVMSAKASVDSKVELLLGGAADYVTKPFSLRELSARIVAALRSPAAEPETLSAGDIRLDLGGRTVSVGGAEVRLTRTEFAILKLLMQNPGTVFSPKRIYRTVWGEEPFGVENAVAVHIRHLREKLEINPSDPRYIKVVWGQGYKMEGGKL